MKAVLQFSILLMHMLPLKAGIQPVDVVKRDLREDWLIFNGTAYEPYKEQRTNVIYLLLNPVKYRGDYLHISSSKSFSVFLNGELVIQECSAVQFSMDSLLQLTGGELLLAVFQQPKVQTDVRTQVVARVIVPVSGEYSLLTRADSGYRNFVIVAGIFILLFLLTLWRYNPRLATDYFSVKSFLSLRESEDHPMFNRITSTTNVVTYIFTSMLLGVLFLQLPIHTLPSVFSTLPTKFSEWLIYWLMSSSVILAVLAVKAIIIFLFSALFNTTAFAGFHFFNFVRFLVLFFGILFFVVILQFLATGSHFLNITLAGSLAVYALTTWVVFVFLKLASAAGRPLIHLFSYICATEIIPLLILIKVI